MASLQGSRWGQEACHLPRRCNVVCLSGQRAGVRSCTAGLPEVSASSMSGVRGRPPPAASMQPQPQRSQKAASSDFVEKGSACVQPVCREPSQCSGMSGIPLPAPHPKERWILAGMVGRAADPTSELRVWEDWHRWVPLRHQWQHWEGAWVPGQSPPAEPPSLLFADRAEWPSPPAWRSGYVGCTSDQKPQERAVGTEAAGSSSAGEGTNGPHRSHNSVGGRRGP